MRQFISNHFKRLVSTQLLVMSNALSPGKRNDVWLNTMGFAKAKFCKQTDGGQYDRAAPLHTNLCGFAAIPLSHKLLEV